MLVHSVFFWLKANLPDEQREAFVARLNSLCGIQAATAVYVGTPAATPARPVLDDTYDYALTVLLEDMAAHDAYQADELHQQFLAHHKEDWERVLIYDVD